MQRVVVVGNSGSGKTTVARALASRLAVPHLELDSIFHQPNWAPLSTPEFRRHVGEFVEADGWVVDGNYSAVREAVWARADTVVWLDLPRRTVMRQLVWRTLRRGVRREELWNGNRERLRGLLRPDSRTNIVLWAWMSHAACRSRYEAAAVSADYAHLKVVRLHRRAEVARWLDDVRPLA